MPCRACGLRDHGSQRCSRRGMKRSTPLSVRDYNISCTYDFNFNQRARSVSVDSDSTQGSPRRHGRSPPPQPSTPQQSPPRQHASSPRQQPSPQHQPRSTTPREAAAASSSKAWVSVDPTIPQPVNVEDFPSLGEVSSRLKRTESTNSLLSKNQTVSDASLPAQSSPSPTPPARALFGPVNSCTKPGVLSSCCDDGELYGVYARH